MSETYTFNPDSINIKNSFTWENPSESWENPSTSKDSGKWTLITSNYPSVELLPHMEDKGMFTDIVDWLRKDAPKKLRSVLNGLDKHRVLPPVPYEYLCRVVYELEFRANEVVEGRMILGPNNEWVQKYFADFPPG